MAAEDGCLLSLAMLGLSRLGRGGFRGGVLNSGVSGVHLRTKQH